MERLGRTARDAISPNVLRVAHLSRPSELVKPLSAWNITHCLVFDEDARLVGVVELRSVAGHSEFRVFSDLVSRKLPPRVSGAAALEEVAVLFRDSGTDAALVFDDGEVLVGLVTRESLLTQLLLQQHEMIARAKQLARQKAFLNRRLRELAAYRRNDPHPPRLDPESLAGAVASDLLPAVARVHELSELLEREGESSLSPLARSSLQRVRAGADHFVQLIDNVRALVDVSRGPLPAAPVNVEDLVAGLMAELRPRFDHQRVSVATRAPFPFVLSHRATVEQVIRTVLLQMVRWGDTEAGLTITLHGEACASLVQLWIEGDRFSVPAENLPQLFGFAPLARPSVMLGNSLEVVAARAALQRAGGELLAESWNAAAVRFCLQIPAAGKCARPPSLQ